MESDCFMELEKAAEKRSIRQTVATAVSAIIHPVAFPLVTLAAITYTQTSSTALTIKLCLIALLMTTLPVAALVGYQVARGHWTDLDVSVRQQRYALYPVGVVFSILMIGAFVLIHAPHGALVAALVVALSNAIDGVINYRYKVSAHATSAAACAALLWIFVPGWGVPSALAAALVGWSRVELGRHTTGQVILGWLVGALSAVAVSLVLP